MSTTALLLASLAYLGVLFVLAYAADRGMLPQRLVRHPLVYSLSLGVYATTWSYYGSVGFAGDQGVVFLTIYLGVTLAFLLTPVLLLPLLRIVRHYQLTSVADLFAFRFSSQVAGRLVTLMMLAGSLPYIALQIRAVAESTQVLSGEASTTSVALVFCLVVTVFAIVFGARHVTPREKHSGLVLAIAFESLLKLVVLLVLAAVAVAIAFDGPAGLQAWMAANPEQLQAFYRGAEEGPWATLMLLSFAAAFLLPRQFHMTFTENWSSRALLTAGWAFPLFLLLLALAIPPILWAGQKLGLEVAPAYYVLALAERSGAPWLAILAYLGGISAASAMIIVSTLALSSMSLNHLVLPFIRLERQADLYASLRWIRRSIIAGLIGAGYAFYSYSARGGDLVSWGLIAFLAMAQLLPGIVGVLFWSGATRAGFIAGLTAGGAVWGLGALLPAVVGSGLPGLDAHLDYAAITFWSLSLNVLLFVGVSALGRTDSAEREAAAACRDLGARLSGGSPQARSAAEFEAQLAPVTGAAAAHGEVAKALQDLGLDWDAAEPEQLHRLRDQIERNLSGMIGPVLARMVVDQHLALDRETRSALAETVRLIELRLENSQRRFRGITAELDRLRRYHRQILEDLPMGVVATSAGRRIARWNPAMGALTGLSAEQALGQRVHELASPWGEFLERFLNHPEPQARKHGLSVGGEHRWLNLHKTDLGAEGGADKLLLVEDITEVQMLERELAHSERLASIGQLAAGVAHEIGNPITGIACLAQELRAESPEQGQCSEQILELTERISTIVRTLVSYAHAGREGGQPTPVDLAQVVDEATRVVRLSRRARALRIDNRLPAGLRTRGDTQRLIQVFVNLFANAADACGSDGEVTVNGQEQGAWLRIEVRDNGPGIPASMRHKVLEPFFTTKPAGQGTGLGLPLVYNIIRDHGGELRLEDGGPGARVILRLPRADDHRD